MISEAIAYAVQFASDAHSDQTRRDGVTPYITHPLTVAIFYTINGEHLSDTALIAAILHDVVEDTDVSLEEIDYRFGNEVAMVVDLVSNVDDKPYDEFIDRIVKSGNVDAAMVKIMDMKHNSLTSSNKAKAKYEKATKRLLEMIN